MKIIDDLSGSMGDYTVIHDGRIPRGFAPSGSIVFSIWHESNSVATAAVYLRENEAERFIYVEPEWRRKGIHTMWSERVTSVLKSLGFKVVSHVDVKNKAMLNAYSHLEPVTMVGRHYRYEF